MKKIISILFLLATLNVYSQTWAPTGATWWYQTIDIFSTYWYTSIQSIGDTTIQGKNCKILSLNQVGGCTYAPIFENVFLYPDTEKVYYYSQDLNKFCLLYDFTKLPDDTLYIHISREYSSIEDSVGFHVDSIGLTIIDTLHLKTQYLTPIYSMNHLTGHHGEIIKFLGHTSFLFPIDFDACDMSFTGGLLCYSDSIINYHEQSLSTDFCRTIGIDEFNVPKKINVFPNPTADFINLGIEENNNYQTRLYDVFGRFITSNNNSSTLDLSRLSEGIYILEIISKDNIKSYIKILKKTL